MTASPSAVPSPARIVSSAAGGRFRSFEGGAITRARVANVTTPTRKESGIWSRKRRAASWAAWSRDGFTSVAVIERETSTTSITVASSRATDSVACGRATPTSSATTATSRTAAGRCRNRPGAPAITFGSNAGVEKRAACRDRLASSR
jgi:hypothetical protein